MILSVGLGFGTVAQDTPSLTTFASGTARITFDYPASWTVREVNNVITLADSEASLTLNLTNTINSGQFKILLAYLTPAQRESANLIGTTPDDILASVSLGTDITLSTADARRYEFERQIAVRGDFATSQHEGAVWVMQMPYDAIVMLQLFAPIGELQQLDNTIIALLRSISLTDITRQLYTIAELDRTLQFTPQQTRLVFTYPQEWGVSEPNKNTVVLTSDNTLISAQYIDYDELSQQGIPIDDPIAILGIQQARSSQPEAYGEVQQTNINGKIYPYSRMIGEQFTGLSLGRDFKVGFLWVTLLTSNDVIPTEHGALAWSLLLNMQYLADAVTLTERVIMPQHQFEFYYPQDWLIKQVSPSSYLLGTSELMTDEQPDSLQFTDDAQMIIQYVPPETYGIASVGTSNATEAIQKFIMNASDLTDYDPPRTLMLGNFEFVQVDFDNPEYSGTALLAPMPDGGALWIQLRTPPNQLGKYEPTALEIARQSRIIRAQVDDTTTNLSDTVFDLLDAEPTPVPTPTLDPNAPPALDDVIQELVSTPIPVTVRELTLELPALNASYTTNFSQLTASYPTDWFIQETLPISDNSPLYENGLRIASNPNLLLADSITYEQGDVEILVQATTQQELALYGGQHNNLRDQIQALVNTLPAGIFDTPLQLRINGELVVMVASRTTSRQTLTLYRQYNDALVVSAQLNVHPTELDMWLPTAVAILQSVEVMR